MLIVITTILAIFVGLLWLFLRFYGITIRLAGVSLRPFTLKGLFFSLKGNFEISVGKLVLQPTLARPTSPHWMLVTIEDVVVIGSPHYKAKCRCLDVTMWFMPTVFRYTAGPVISVGIPDFIIDVDQSSKEPWWLHDIRLNLTDTIMQGNTTRIHDIKTKVWLWKPASPPRQTAVEQDEAAEEHESIGAGANESEEAVRTPDAYLSDADSFIEDEGQDIKANSDETETRIRASVFQLFVRNLANHRMYSMGKVDVEVKRPWSAPPLPKAPAVTEEGLWPGSLLVRLQNCKWTKLPRIEEAGVEKPWSITRSLFRTITSFPGFARRIRSDPMLYVDLDVRKCEMNYKEFRLRDADVVMEAAKMVHKSYAALSSPQRQALHDFAWDLFATGVTWAFGAHEELQQEDPGIPHIEEHIEPFTHRSGKHREEQYQQHRTMN